ncbi:hypothetical protein [Ideonella alba]|uniref:DUF4410 domain-containing protein n=1 Tax=Ideonella alba TaxID=2824118 RepID=A0A940YCG7_9BURK|nr:hypothetical protein [Ideonella alba]MBQ0930117.1 hypothetical protein [Ideonella alba]
MTSVFLATGRRVAALSLIAVAALATGCASVTVPVTASAPNVERLKSSPPAPMGVGEFKAAPGKAADADKGLSVRGGNTIAPQGGSFAVQLRDQLAAELKGAGLLSTDGRIVVSGTITDNNLDAGIGKGIGRLAARFQVKRDGAQVFDKELVAAAEWESSFMGAVAIPAAFNQYGALYQKLIGQLFDDADFKAAVKR